MDDRQQWMRGVRRVVVKIGTGVLTTAGRIDRAVLDGIAADCAQLIQSGREVIVVSSGAIALGVGALGYPARPKTMDALQACAAAGQGELIRLWQEAFRPHEKVVAQVLLTHADLADRKRYLNARRALAELSRRKAVAVINENDTVSVDEIAFGDNDALSAQVANLVGADLLVMLSVAPALLDGDVRVPVVRADDSSAEGFVRTGTSSGGKGGMVTKVRAGRAAASVGAGAVIAPGRERGVLARVLAGEDVGTFFVPSVERMASRKHWIAHTLRAKGTVVVDDGASRAVVAGKSLLPSGITEVRGEFGQGEAVDVSRLDGAVIARGITAYGSDELAQIRGKKTAEIEPTLGYHLGDEVVHADDLVLLPG
ncbi:MAG: glutamate 5-kinase [Polyangiales bacterium]